MNHNIDWVHRDIETLIIENQKKILEDNFKIKREEYYAKLQSNWNSLKKWLEENWKASQDVWFVKIINKMNELEGEVNKLKKDK